MPPPLWGIMVQRARGPRGRLCVLRKEGCPWAGSGRHVLPCRYRGHSEWPASACGSPLKGLLPAGRCRGGGETRAKRFTSARRRAASWLNGGCRTMMKRYDSSPNPQAAGRTAPGAHPWRSSNSSPRQSAATATNGTTAARLCIAVR